MGPGWPDVVAVTNGKKSTNNKLRFHLSRSKFSPDPHNPSVSPPKELTARICRAAGCSRLGAESASWSDRGTVVHPTHPLTPIPNLDPNPNPSPDPNPDPKRWTRNAAAPLQEIYVLFRSADHRIALGQWESKKTTVQDPGGTTHR